MARKKAAAAVVEHSPNFGQIKDYYDRGLWKIKAVRNAAARGWITAAEFEEITGEVYE